MIKHLSGDYETVEYDAKKYVMLYDNVQTEAYPIHWHDAVEIIMPLKNEYKITVGDTEYLLPENDVIIVPPGELHSMPAIPGRRLIFQCDNSVLSEVTVLEPVTRVMTAPVIINSSLNKDLHKLAQKTMLDIQSLYTSNNELSDVKIYLKVIELFMAISELQLQQQKIIMDCDDEKLGE